MALESKEIVALHQVDKIYPPNQAALRGINAKIDRGEFVFLAGASGAGKTTFLRMLFAEERATRGQVLVDGRNLVSVSRREVCYLRRNIGVIFQDYKLITTRSAVDNVAFALEVIGVRRRERMQLAYKMLESLGLKDRAHSMPLALSGGEQQRVAIARALVNRPQLILADEPTGNLDPDITASVFSLLVEANECGATVIVASHNLSLIEQVNRRTLVLEHGRLIGDFDRPRG